MIMKLIHGIVLLAAWFLLVPGKCLTSEYQRKEQDTISIRNDFNQFFEKYQVEGSIVLFDNSTGMWITNDSVNAKRGFLPASTFKIINLLIALETGVIKDENEIIKFPGNIDTVKYGYRPDIYHDMSVKEGFKKSAVWVYVELARRIGKDKYKHYLRECSYGNLDLSEPDEDFWNFGAFRISPFNQVNFLKNVYERKVPFSDRSIDILQNVMMTEQTENYLIRAKTGWTSLDGINIGWWVGYIERNEGVVFFATNLLQERKLKRTDFGQRRIEITQAILEHLGIIP